MDPSLTVEYLVLVSFSLHSHAGTSYPVIARHVVTWQSMARGGVLYLDVGHGLLRFARNDGWWFGFDQAWLSHRKP